MVNKLCEKKKMGNELCEKKYFGTGVGLFKTQFEKFNGTRFRRKKEMGNKLCEK